MPVWAMCSPCTAQRGGVCTRACCNVCRGPSWPCSASCLPGRPCPPGLDGGAPYVNAIKRLPGRVVVAAKLLFFREYQQAVERQSMQRHVAAGAFTAKARLVAMGAMCCAARLAHGSRAWGGGLGDCYGGQAGLCRTHRLAHQPAMPPFARRTHPCAGVGLAAAGPGVRLTHGGVGRAQGPRGRCRGWGRQVVSGGRRCFGGSQW